MPFFWAGRDQTTSASLRKTGIRIDRRNDNISLAMGRVSGIFLASDGGFCFCLGFHRSM
jgi:hypothetical protein